LLKVALKHQKNQNQGANPRRIGDRLVWVVRSNDLAPWATRAPAIKFVSDLRQVGGYLWVLRFTPRYNLNIVESCVKHHNPNSIDFSNDLIIWIPTIYI
jgi:hypothetical protein